MKPFISRLRDCPANAHVGIKNCGMSLTAIICAIALISLVTNRVAANTRWTGNVSDSWFDAGNWDNGIPATNFAVTQRAQIEGITDLANWPVIKSGETVNLSQRLFLPLAPVGAEPITYARLTIESGGTLNATSDFRAGEDDGNEFQVMVGSLNVAGMLVTGNRTRFGNNDYMTVDVDVTGTMIHTDIEQTFRIGGGEGASADFHVSGTGLVSVAGPFELFEGSLLSLSDDGTLTLLEYEYVIEDEFGNPIGTAIYTKAEIIDLVTDFATQGLFEGLTDSYSGSESLTGIGNGLAYYEGGNSVSFVAAPVQAFDGDYNEDGFVDAADYVVWRKTLGSQEAYEAWTQNFGSPVGVGGGAVSDDIRGVPECSTLSLFGCGLFSFSPRRLRRSKALAFS
ncbi:MAG: hypothetical protein WD738_19960 [Pirellulales bacterium]